MERSFFVLAVLYAITALIAPAESGSRGWVRLGAYTAVSAAILCLVLFPFGLMQRSFFTIVQRLIGNDTLVAARESLTETIRYYRHDVYGDPHYYRLVTNDHSMAGTTLASKRYMKLYVYLPVALRTEMKTALLISFGVGSTAKALVDTASLREIDVVDISRDILDLSTVVYSGADNPLRDQRVHVTIEDGRFFLSSTTRRYDLITSEPPPPKLAGVVNLYSAEYFRLIRDHLTPGGYATYWLPAHQLTATDTLAVIKAFCNAFENCSLWSGGGLEWMLMGSNGAGEPVSADAFAAQWHDAGVAPELAALAFESPAQMGSLFIGDAEQLAAFTEHAAPVTDNYPLRLSGTIPDDQERVPLYAQLMDENARLARFRASAYVRSIWPSQLVEQSTPYFRYERMLKNKLIGDRYSDPADRFVWDGIDDMLTYTALKTLPLWLLGSDRDVLSIVSHSPRNEPRFELELAIGATAQRDFQGALAHVERYAHSAKMGLGDLSLMLYLLAKNDRTADARAMLAGMDPRLSSDMSEFTAWFDARFGETQPVDVAP
jgi:spermidine synthase